MITLRYNLRIVDHTHIEREVASKERQGYVVTDVWFEHETDSVTVIMREPAPKDPRKNPRT